MNTVVDISYSSKVFKPEFIKNEQAIGIRSPIDLKLTPRTSAHVETEVKINWWLNKTKWDTIMIHLKNISFYYNIEIRKGDIIAFVYFNGSFFEIKYKQD